MTVSASKLMMTVDNNQMKNEFASPPKKGASTMRLGSQTTIKGVQMVPLTEEIILKVKKDFSLPTKDLDRVIPQD